MRTRTLAAEVLGGTPWCEPSRSPPLAPPKSPGRLQCWVASGKTTNREGTQPHPSTVKWIKVLLSPDHHSNSQLYPPPEPPIKPLSLNHQRADSRSKKNYNPAACGTKTTFTERQVKKQRAIYQMKEQDKTPEKQLNEVEIGNLPEKEFRIMVVKMIQDLGIRMETKIEKMQEMFNKDLEELKNKQR